MVLKNKLFLQILRFGTVGVAAAMVQLFSLMLLVETNLLHPLAANIIAFMIAFQVSYWGHRHFTFGAHDLAHITTLPRLFVLAVCTFMANEFLFYIFLNLFHLQYMLALIVVLAILPVATFSLSKFWVFR
jgi:putative flippase GtrA